MLVVLLYGSLCVRVATLRKYLSLSVVMNLATGILDVFKVVFASEAEVWVILERIWVVI